MDNRDEKYMRLALDEARRAFDEGEVPIGAVVVGGDRLLGRGHNLVETLCDATAHAEMQAITAATSTLGGKYLSDCTLYVTVEPCAMCAGAIAWSQVGEVVFGASDPKKGFRRYSRDILPPKIKLREGVLKGECEAIMNNFFSKLRN
ncbi:MAG: nucleoside deaminase [Rikenellaceae bacterium]